MARRTALLAVALIAEAFFGGRASIEAGPSARSTTQARTTPRQTVAKIFVPWQLNGTLSSGLSIERRASGSCWIGSLAVDDPDAWRCMTAGAIFDPCFAPQGNANPPEVVCAIQPSDGKVILLRLKKPLPQAAANPYGSPEESERSWAIELANGDSCLLGTGANGSIGGVTIAYYCASGDAAGPLDETRRPWTVEYERPRVDYLAPVDVSVAWYG